MWCMCMHVRGHEGGREGHWMTAVVCLTPLRQGISWSPELVRQQSPTDSPISSTALGLQVQICLFWIFSGMLGIQTQVFKLKQSLTHHLVYLFIYLFDTKSFQFPLVLINLAKPENPRESRGCRYRPMPLQLAFYMGPGG